MPTERLGSEHCDEWITLSSKRLHRGAAGRFLLEPRHELDAAGEGRREKKAEDLQASLLI